VEAMIEASAVFISQLLLVFFKHLNVRMIANHKVGLAVIITGAIQASWLVSSALGIKGFLESNYLLICIYITGGMIGSFLNFKIKV
jgi:hypothetical protein